MVFRMLPPVLVIVLGACSALAGCEQIAPSKPDKPKAAESEPEAPQATAEAKPALPQPRDLDVDSLREKLGCGRLRKKACGILKEFAKAKRWEWHSTSMVRRWVGNAYMVSEDTKKKDEKRAVVLWAKIIPTAQVDPGLIALQLGAGMLSEKLKYKRWTLIDAVSRLAAVGRGNPAYQAAAKFEPGTPRGAQQSQGISVTWIAEDMAYFRQDGRKLLPRGLRHEFPALRVSPGVHERR